MASFELNEEQKEFINSDKCNVLVSASAGSGKTSTMIKKLIQIILEKKVPLKELLVLTFTEAAASEIKQKLFAEFTEIINTTTDSEIIKYIKIQLENINNAEIGTLHSVCKKLITKYFYELEESPDFTLLSDKESKYLLDNAISKVFLDRIKKDDHEFFDLYDCYNSKRNDNTLKQMILTIIDYINNKPNYDEWIKNFIGSSYNTNLKENSVCNYLLDYYKSKLESCIPRIEKLLQIDGGKYENWLYNKRQFVDEFLNSSDYEQASKILSNVSLLSKPTKSRNPSVDESIIDEQMEKFNKDFGVTYTDLKDDILENLDEVKNNLALSKNNLLTLISVAKEVKDTYTRLKKKKNSLDFNDLEDKMLELLEIDYIKDLLKNSYKYIFFDEYQDINEKQELILTKLMSNDNYYMIGDVKQSIYAFRQSSPHIFIEKFNRFASDGRTNKLINFNRNYRSDKNILEFNNLVFDTLITEKTIGIDYKNNARFISSKDFDKSSVTLNLIDTSTKMDEIDDEESEAILIGNEISKLLLTKKSNGENFSFRDIAIILRKRGTFVRTLCNVLQDMQIPVFAKVNNDFFATFEVNLLISILKVVCNYKNDIPLAVVLKNLFNLSEEELYLIRNNDKFDNFYSAVFEYNAEDEIKGKLDKFKRFLDLSIFKLAHMTIYEYLNDVISEFNLIVKIKGMTSGDEKVGNVYEFLSLSNSKSYEYNLDKFIEYLDFISKDTSLQSIGTSGNAVEIITIHHSKGLEYPAVIFAGLGKKLTINKDTSDVIINKDFGIGLKAIDNNTRTLMPTVVHSACKLNNRKWEMDEEIRLLYVAMTRAKEKLILVGEYNKDKIQTVKYKDIYSLSNYMEFILKSLESQYYSHFQNKEHFVVNEEKESAFEVNVYDINSIFSDTNEENEQIIFSNVDDRLLSSLEYIYSNIPSAETNTIKNTVTNILKEESDYENLNFTPRTLSPNDKIPDKNYLKIGTTYHAIMESLKFNESFDDIVTLIKDLTINNVIDKEYAKEIDPAQIFIAKEVVGKFVNKAKNVYREKQFLLQENYNKLIKNSDNNTKVIVQGVIDLVVEMDDGAYLIDYKTNRTKNEDFLKNEYKLQLEIYKKAFEKATNIPIKRTFLYSFYMGKLIEVV